MKSNLMVSVVNNYFDWSQYPGNVASVLREEAVQEKNWAKDATARALFLAQVICSLVAVPLTFLGILLAMASLFCRAKTASMALMQLVVCELLHLAAIPTYLLAAMLPHSMNWDSPMKQLRQWMVNQTDHSG